MDIHVGPARRVKCRVVQTADQQNRDPVRVIIKKDSGTQKKDSRRTPFLAK